MPTSGQKDNVRLTGSTRAHGFANAADARKSFARGLAMPVSETPRVIPVYSCSVRAGLPSPADETIDAYIDLHDYLIKNPMDTFFVKASGDSMEGAGIQSGDLLVVDGGLEPLHGKIVIAAIDGEITVKRLSRQGGWVQLLAANDKYPTIDIHDESHLVIWGVVTHVIHVPE